MSISIKNIINQNVKGKSVLLRADLNIPMFGAEITDTSRLKRLIPTIEFLKNSGAKVIICSHLGRPDGEFNEAYSLKPLLNKLSKALNIEVKFVESCIGSFAIKAKESLKPGEILLLENVRFHKGEIKNDIEFAEELSKKCDMFVNDAFSCSHRAHSSLHAITKFLPSYSGILLNEEVTALESVLNSPSKPIAALVGGAKISTKINIIEYLITKMDYIIIGGGMANTFLVANGFSVGKSLYEKDSVTLAKSILEKSKKYNCEIILPIDLVVANKFEANTDTQIVPFEMIPSDMMALDVGPKSINKMNDILTNVKTLLWNGPLGAFEIEPFGNGTFSLAKLASQLTEEKKLITVAGGGDTSFALNKAGVAEKFTYISSAYITCSGSILSVVITQ